MRAAFARWAFATDRQRRRSPWQNGYAEPPIGSIRRERLDDVIVFGERNCVRCRARTSSIRTALGYILRWRKTYR